MQPRHCSCVAPRISSVARAFRAHATLSKIQKGLSRSVLGRSIMRHIRKLSSIAVLAGASAAAIAASAVAAEYSMTVNRDRLVNAQIEPQNWLMMNGDYGSMRYSKLTQFNRDKLNNLRMGWGRAL